MTRLRATAWRRDIELVEPYTIAYDTYDRTVNFFLRIESDDGAIGLGCAAPAPEVTGEDAIDCGDALEAAVAILDGAPMPLPVGLRTRLQRPLEGCPAAAAAVDTALWDWRARSLGVPLHALWGRCRESVRTSVTLGIEPVGDTVRRGVERVRQGFRALKVKGGHDVTEDAERLHRLREAVGPDVALLLDANQGYDREQTLELWRASSSCRIELLEQPCPATDHGTLAELTRTLRPLPIIADESFVGLPDAARICASAGASGLNIKLMKVGGLANASAADAIAAAHAMPCMVSCMDESALAIAAALHWCLTRPNVRWVDLDGHLDLVEDPAAAAVHLQQGTLKPLDAPGLGVDIQPDPTGPQIP